MPDDTMAEALYVGRLLSAVEELPPSLVNADARAELVDVIDCPIRPGPGRVAMISPDLERLIPDVADPIERASIALRLWGGCVAGAKTIADKTNDGPNTPADRAHQCAALAGVPDPIFRAGVEAAPAFRQRRSQPFFLEGVPLDSPLRAFLRE